MDAFKNKTPSPCQLCLTCFIALVFVIMYSGFTFTRNAPVNMLPNSPIINTVLQNKTSRPSKTEAFLRDSTPCLKDAFKDILLVIVFNYPFYDSIPHLKALYKPAFPHLVFCGPPHNTARRGVLTVNVIKGFLGYECLGRAIRKYPGYQGYFYISDDVIMKYWNKLPEVYWDRLWDSYPTETSPISGPASSQWYWWRTRYGLDNCRRALEDVAKMNLAEKKLNGSRLINTLLKNSNGTLLCYHGRSDVLYVPKRHAKAFSILSEVFYKQKVFLEIAMPTIYRLLEQNGNIFRLPGYYLPGRVDDPRVTDSRYFWYLYFQHNEYYFLHPFKLHREGIDSKFNLVMMKYFFMDKAKALTNCTSTPLSF